MIEKCVRFSVKIMRPKETAHDPEKCVRFSRKVVGLTRARPSAPSARARGRPRIRRGGENSPRLTRCAAKRPMRDEFELLLLGERSRSPERRAAIVVA
jgi:hypothetical protein